MHHPEQNKMGQMGQGNVLLYIGWDLNQSRSKTVARNNEFTNNLLKAIKAHQITKKY